MAANYDFHDEWEIHAPVEAAWDLISHSADWERWWPGLKSAVITNHNPEIIGSSVELRWRSKTGYHLQHRVTVTEVEPDGTIKFRSAGDLIGNGSWQFVRRDRSTHMIIDWHVRTTKAWMNMFAPLLRPVFLRNHDSLMKNGEKGLNRYLQASLTDV